MPKQPKGRASGFSYKAKRGGPQSLRAGGAILSPRPQFKRVASRSATKERIEWIEPIEWMNAPEETTPPATPEAQRRFDWPAYALLAAVSAVGAGFAAWAYPI